MTLDVSYYYSQLTRNWLQGIMSLAQGHRWKWLSWDSHLELFLMGKEMLKADRAHGAEVGGHFN